ncbi:MAG: M14 family zinc carboxypeptidase [Candidatus Marinimicrobia bacterium]|nr:M14 family zinc carboxypeptidase [Candidatus Neomarinimicrobiota bacterium]
MDKKEFIVRRVLLILLAVNISHVLSQDIYKSIRVWSPDPEKIQGIQQLGIALDHSIIRPGLYVDIVISEIEEKILLSNGIIFTTIINDLTRYYQAQNIPAIQRDFPLGTMQGNYTWTELNLRFDELKELYPDIISEKLIIGQSNEGNDIWAFKLSDNPAQDENEPEILYSGLTHAREPLSMMNLFYFVQKICEGYTVGDDLEAIYLVNERENWFVPVVNPDGYIYNEFIEPSGGGMHRKNRRDTGCGSGTEQGVDINRNYSYNWGANDTGSSPDPCYATYRGEEAFSEPETQAVRDFIEQREFVNVFHYHSYGNMYIHPFGDSSFPDEPDLTIYRELAQEMAAHNNFNVGTGFEMVGYTVNGDAVDWSYGEKNIIAYTPEIGSSGHGFWPSSDQVESICANQYIPNKIFSFSAGSDFVLDGYSFTSDVINSGEIVGVELIIKNRGLMSSNGPVTVTVEPLNNLVNLDETVGQVDYLGSWETHTFNFEIEVSEHVTYYSKVALKIISKDSVSYHRPDTIEFYIGAPSIIYTENYDEGLGQWNTNGDWGLTNNPAYGDYALTDSPSGNYGADQTTTVTLEEEFDYNFMANPYVSFNARWEIEDGFDFVRFQALTSDNGWVSLQGQHTVPGNGVTVQPLGEHGYDGSQLNWVEEKIFLDQLDGQAPTAFRFIQTSDELYEGDGFTIDNFALMGYMQGAAGDFFPDGSVNISDILGLADFILDGNEASPYIVLFCDMNGDGQINILDLFILVNSVIGT